MKKMIIVLSIAGAILVGAGTTDNYFEISKNLEIFSDLYKNINLFYVDDTRPGDLMKQGIDAMLKTLDPYTVYFPESRIEDYRFATTGQYGGIGALIRTVEGGTYISEPHQGFPAEKMGLIAGDKILAIDGNSVEGKSQDEISEVLKGQSGTTVSVEVMRTGETESRTFEIKREEIKIPDVPYSGMIDEKIGYVKLSSFTQTAAKEVKSAFIDLKKEGMENLVLDLRGNPGGLLQQAINIVNFFVPKGTPIVSTQGKISDWDKSYSGLNEPLDKEMPVIVLVDESSASASEIVSGTLQDLDRGVVLGHESFGKGLVQQTKDLPYGTKLKVTVAKYYTPSGRCIQRIDHSSNNGSGDSKAVPDSLIQAFKTSSGRTVYDGRGITPDIAVEKELLGDVVEALAKKHLFFRFANEYVAKYPNIDDPALFSISTEDYKWFEDFVHGYDISYTTDTEMRFEELMKIAKEEKYFDDASTEFETLQNKIAHNSDNDLKKFKDQIVEILENEIVSRYFFQNGRVEHALNNDQFIARAKTVFYSSEYMDILNTTK